MSQTYRIGAWTVEAEKQQVTAKHNGKKFSLEASRASHPHVGRALWLAEFVPALWNTRTRSPFERRLFLVLDWDGKFLAKGETQAEALERITV